MRPFSQLKKRFVLSFVTGLFMLSLLFSGTACTSSQPITLTTFALDTVCQITVYRQKDKQAAEKTLAELRSYEAIFSRTLENSELYQLNHQNAEPYQISSELYDVINDAVAFSELSQGAFDITLGGVQELYHFADAEPAVPDQAVLKEALSHTGMQHLHLLEDNTILIDDPLLQIDLGAIAKGYIADKLKESLVSQGVKSALISLGGNLLAIGEKPDRNPFILGIRYPEKESQEVIKTLEITDASLVTSGTYERSFANDGQLYHHILDTRTGQPVRNDLLSCSITSPSSETADALSTLCFILGPEASRPILTQYPNTTAHYITNTLEIITIPE